MSFILSLSPELGLSGAAFLLQLVLLLLGVMGILALTLIPSLLSPGARPLHAAKAAYCYLLQAVGIFLMSISAIPALFSILTSRPVNANMYLVLLVLFTLGALTALWHDNMLQEVDAPSRLVPSLLYRMTMKLAGYLVTIFATFSLLLNMLFGAQPADPSTLILPLLLLAYGLLLLWGHRGFWAPGRAQAFASTVIKPVPAKSTLIVSKSKKK